MLSVSGESRKNNVSLADRSDIELEIKESEEEPKVAEAQRKRDSGYSYSRPSKYASSQRLEPLIVRGRIVRKNPGAQAGGRPFSQYGPPRFRQTSGGNRNQQELHITLNDFAGPQSGGAARQRVPSPIRDFDFAEPSPIAGQNSVPFNTNSANYLPPQNQKLPSNAGPYGFLSQQNQAQSNHQSLRISQSQSLLREPARPQISDAAAFLSQNSQAISQLYETPASNQNQEPFHEEQGSNANFQNFRPEPVNLGLGDASFFRGTIPSYSSGILDRDALQNIKSLEKDRLINQLQHALVENQAKSNSLGTTRYAQNHENPDFTQSQSFFGFQGQINPSVGPQLDRPANNLNQRPHGTSAASFIPLGSSSTPGYNYGPPSTTPPSQSPSSTLAAPTIASTSRPSQSINGEETSQSASSVPAPSNPPSLQIPQFGGFVPSFINTNFLTNYPTYGTNFLASGTSSINQVQSSSPTQFGIPIPTFPIAQGTTLTSNHPTIFKPQPLPQNPQQNQPIPVQPINPTFPLVPAATPIQPLQNPVTTTAVGHPNYGVQPAPVNPLILKPIKPLYPLYYYPNVYQIQKPGLATLPWNYAPSYSQVRPDQAWK